jgi:hypothetical protein
MAKVPKKSVSGFETPKSAKDMMDLTGVTWRVNPAGVAEWLGPEKTMKSMGIVRAVGSANKMIGMCDSSARWSRFSIKNMSPTLSNTTSTPAASFMATVLNGTVEPTSKIVARKQKTLY